MHEFPRWIDTKEKKERRRGRKKDHFPNFRKKEEKGKEEEGDSCVAAFWSYPDAAFFFFSEKVKQAEEGKDGELRRGRRGVGKSDCALGPFNPIKRRGKEWEG